MSHLNPGTKVTIGLPTYRRPEMLRRALFSIALQCYENIEVIIGDNDAGCASGEMISAEFKCRIPSLFYFRHEQNIGPIANMMFCLSKATGKYFMWLADDDELGGERYLHRLVNILENNEDAATAVALWQLKRSPDDPGKIQSIKDYRSNWWLLRACKFIWHGEDDFFYGLHRLECIKNAKYTPYWPLNRGDILDWAYPYLLDLIAQGKVIRLRDSNCTWCCHAYTVKHYTRLSADSIVVMKYIVRRLNVHWLYLVKTYFWGGLLFVPPVFIVSSAAFLRECIRLFYNFVRYMARKCFRNFKI